MENDISFSYRKVEKFLGVSQNKWKAWAGGQQPNAKDLKKIAQKLNLNPEWLLMGSGDPEKKTNTTIESIPCVQTNPEDALAKTPNDLEIMKRTTEVLASNTHYAMSLRHNVNSFYSAIQNDEKINGLEKRIEQLERRSEHDDKLTKKSA